MRRLIYFVSTIVTASALPNLSSDADGCKVDAWVRAPDFQPNAVITGDYRIRGVGPGCDFAKAFLVLRLAERSDLKYQKEDAVLPPKPDLSHHRRLDEDTWDFAPSFFGYGKPLTEEEYAQLDTFKQSMKNTSLWTVASIEKTAFTASLPLEVDAVNSSSSFALIVPNVNYPPGVEFTSYSSAQDGQHSDSQHIYQYFVDIEHTNGTKESVPAGYTSFHPSLPPVTGPEQSTRLTKDVQRGRWACEGDRCNLPPLPSCADDYSNFTADIDINTHVIQRGK